MSSPVGPSLDYVARRRSYAGKPSAPVYSPTAAAFKEHLQGVNLREHEAQLLYDGLITEDMSDRIVANLPKGLSDYSHLRGGGGGGGGGGSRESLRSGSQENMLLAGIIGQSESNSTNNNTVAASSHSTKYAQNINSTNGASGTQQPRTNVQQQSTKSKSGFISQYSAINALTVMLSRHGKPHKKVMRRAASCSTVEPAAAVVNQRDNGAELKERRDGKTLSMATSTDSLPR